MAKSNKVMPAIRFLVETYSSYDNSGNPYRWSRITSTINGRTLSVGDVGGAQNVPHKVYNALEAQRPVSFDVWSWIHYTEIDVPRKRFKQPADAVYEGNLQPGMILALEEA